MIALELELHVELHSAGWLGRNRMSEKRGRDDPDVSHVIFVIEHVEGIESDGERARFFARFRKHKVMGEIEIQFDHAWPGHRIAQYASRTVVDDAILIVVGSRRDIDWFSRIERERHSAVKYRVGCDDANKSNLCRRSLSERAQSPAGS